MKLFITALSAATGPSGICRHAQNLARCAASGSRMTRITLVIGKWQEAYFRSCFYPPDAKVDLVCIDISNDAFSRNLWYLREMPALAAEMGADVIHLSFPVPIQRSALHCPVVVSLHDLYPYDEPDNFGFPRVFFNRVFLQQCMRQVDCISCVSETTLSRLKARFPRFAHRKGVVIPNCVTIDSIESQPPREKCDPFFLMVGQHRANKNISFAIKVFDELLQRERIAKNAVLLVVGNDGPETAAIRDLINLRALQKNVQLKMRVNDGELRWLYENCELLIAPSWTEGFGLPVVEGLLCGSRVVCSDISVFREVGGSACHYFDLHARSATSAMYTAMCQALTESAKRPEGLERFSLGKVAREYAALYARLVEDTLSVAETCKAP